MNVAVQRPYDLVSVVVLLLLVTLCVAGGYWVAGGRMP